MWRLQLHGPLEQCCDDGLELPSREELKARAVRPFPDEDPHELTHDGFGVFHQLGEPAANLIERRQGELSPDVVPGLCGIGVSWHDGVLSSR